MPFFLFEDAVTGNADRDSEVDDLDVLVQRDTRGIYLFSQGLAEGVRD